MQPISLTEPSLKRENSISSISPTKNLISVPVDIPRTNSQGLDLNTTEQYSLKMNIFDPSKMSPPNQWKCRLEQRIKEFEIKSKINKNK